VILWCKKATRLVSEELDRPLSFWEYFRLRFHLMICYPCRVYRRQVLGLTALLRRRFEIISAEDVPSPLHLSPEARQRLDTAIRNHLPKT
jgi:hypothetical protein